MNLKKELELKKLIDKSKVERRIRQLAREISVDYSKSPEPLLIVGVLKGCIFFLSQLLRSLKVPFLLDFVIVKSYKGTQSGELKLLFDLSIPVSGKDVLIVDDILDTGKTLKFLVSHIQERGPRSIKTCVLLSKRIKRDFQADYTGFSIPNVFVIGYGLDFDENLRGLPHIYFLEKGGISR